MSWYAPRLDGQPAGGTIAVGLRFRPGAIGDVRRINMVELRDRRVAAGAVFGGRRACDLTGPLVDSESDMVARRRGGRPKMSSPYKSERADRG